MKPDLYKKLKAALMVLSVLATMKMLFFAFGQDEEYQLVMAYRNIRGDRLFYNMWEPHQSSAFLCSLLMRPYLAVFGKTGLVIYLRLCGTLIHLGISMYLHKVLKRMLHADSAFLLALIYFNTIPKQIMLPEFGIMQVWFFTLMSLFLIEYYDSDVGNRIYLVFAALSLVFVILSYPSCLVLFFFVLAVLWHRSGERRLLDMGLVTGICTACGAAYLALLLRNSTLKELFHTLLYIVKGDVTHSLAPGDKLLLTGKELVFPVLLCTGVFLLAGFAARVLTKKDQDAGRRDALKAVLVVAFSCIVELFSWVVLNTGYEIVQLHLVVFAVLGIVYYRKGRKEDKQSTARARLRRGLLLDGIIGSGILLAAVLYLTDFGFRVSPPHAMLAAFFGIALVVMWWEKKERPACVYVILMLWAFTAVFGKGYSVRSAPNYANVLESGGILKHGPAAGTISNYMTAYIYNCDYEDWESYIQDGDKVLIMADQVMNLGTIQYLFKDVEICHFSVVNPAAYDGRLLEYWEKFPDKKPNVIIVDAWYGQLMTDPKGWMMQYIENEFGYSSMSEGRYIRIYRK